jgi:hypothetical protein
MGLLTYRRPQSLAKYMLFALTVVLAAATLAVVASGGNSKSYAEGQGSPPECEEGPNVDAGITGTGDEISHTVSAGNVVTGVCIKTGQEGHSDPLANGTFDGAFNPVAPDSDAACYVVEGVGTQEVTVTRVGDGPDCQDLSHIDVLFGPPPPPTTGAPPTTAAPKEVAPSVPAPVRAAPVFTG